MTKKYKEIILTNADNVQVVLKQEYYSYSLLNLLQRYLLFLNIHIGWKLQYLYETVCYKNQKKHLTYENKSNHLKPLLYSCSGCSSAAQMANYIAVQLDRNGTAEMSCIVGVGGNVKKLVRTALSGRKIITIDGCPLACSRACLGNHSIVAHGQFELTSMGVEKRNHEDFDLTQAKNILKHVEQKINTLNYVA